jgi:uncharacterized RDD family membrane protein YckC
MVKIGSDATVAAGETVRELVVVCGNAKLEGEVTGDLVVVFGDADVNGRVGGDCVSVFGSLKRGPKADINGATVVVGGELAQDVLAQLRFPAKEFSLAKLRHVVEPLWKWLRDGLFLGRPLPPTSGLAWGFVGLFFLIYLIIAVLMPRPVECCVEVLDRRAVSAFLVGVLACMLYAPLAVVLLLTGIGILILPFVKLALLAATFVGKTAAFQFIGLQLVRRFDPQASPRSLVAFLIGCAVVTVLYMVPILGFVLWGVLIVLGLGAALLALFAAFRRNGTGAGSPTACPPGPAGGPANPVAPAGPAGSAPAMSGATVAAQGPAEAPPALAGPPPVAPGLTALEYAAMPRVGFWLRFAASLLDLILLGWLLSHAHGFGVLLWLAYHIGMWAWRGTTIGGIVCGIKIVRVDGRPVDFGVAVVRALAGLFSGLALGLGFFWAGWTRERQSWHDKIAGTIIVKVPKGVSLI